MKRVSQVIVMIAVALSLGLHWVALQSVAWVSMFAAYSAGNTLSTAIEKTFDADNKCEICLLVEEGTREDWGPESSYTVKLVKLDACPAVSPLAMVAPSLVEVALLSRASLLTEVHYPPTSPPPRA